MIAREAVVTFERVDGITRSFGFISGSAERRRSGLAMTFRSLGALLGLSTSEWITDAEALRSGALDMLRKKGYELGANAIVNLQFHTEENEDVCRVIAFGEAVVLEKGAS
jgi:uncharacterized protein YbjQ (UPF0145 family)